MAWPVEVFAENGFADVHVFPSSRFLGGIQRLFVGKISWLNDKNSFNLSFTT